MVYFRRVGFIGLFRGFQGVGVSVPAPSGLGVLGEGVEVVGLKV